MVNEVKISSAMYNFFAHFSTVEDFFIIAQVCFFMLRTPNCSGVGTKDNKIPALHEKKHNVAVKFPTFFISKLLGPASGQHT